MTALAGRQWLSRVGLEETELLEKLMEELVCVSWRSHSVGRSQHLVHAALLECAVNQNGNVNTPVYRRDIQALFWVAVNIQGTGRVLITFNPPELLERC
jgi:hypothetical protein